MYMYFEKIYVLVKFFVIDKSVYNTGFKILTILKVFAYPEIKKIKYDERYINYFVSSAGVHFP